MSTATAHSKPRIELYDNIKGVLIVLVVIGHFMHPVHNDNPTISAGFDIIYLFHMPLFVFMSGLFAKGAYRDGKLAINRIISYLVLGFAYQAALVLINGSALFPKLFLFSSAPWYLIAMAWWYAMTPLLARVRPAVGIAASCAVALAWGVVDLSSGLSPSAARLRFCRGLPAGTTWTPNASLASAQAGGSGLPWRLPQLSPLPAWRTQLSTIGSSSAYTGTRLT